MKESCATIHKKTFFSHVDLDVDNLDIRVFYEDEDGTMLIGSEIGLYTYSKGTINKIAMNSWKNWPPTVFCHNEGQATEDMDGHIRFRYIHS